MQLTPFHLPYAVEFKRKVKEKKLQDKAQRERLGLSKQQWEYLHYEFIRRQQTPADEPLRAWLAAFQLPRGEVIKDFVPGRGVVYAGASAAAASESDEE